MSQFITFGSDIYVNKNWVTSVYIKNPKKRILKKKNQQSQGYKFIIEYLRPYIGHHTDFFKYNYTIMCTTRKIAEQIQSKFIQNFDKMSDIKELM